MDNILSLSQLIIFSLTCFLDQLVKKLDKNCKVASCYQSGLQNGGHGHGKNVHQGHWILEVKSIVAMGIEVMVVMDMEVMVLEFMGLRA